MHPPLRCASYGVCGPRRYDASVAKHLESAYQSYSAADEDSDSDSDRQPPIVHFVAQGMAYTANVKTMTQQNQHTGFQRRIRRRAAGGAERSGASRSMPKRSAADR